MLTEIEVEGVGIMRHLNEWQQERWFKMARGPNRVIAPAAFGLGMSLQQFKRLPVDQQKAALEAYNRLLAPPPMKGMEGTASRQNRLPRPWERISEDRQIELGRILLAKKAELPKGHFLPWLANECGIGYRRAASWMQKARAHEAVLTMGSMPLRNHVLLP